MNPPLSYKDERNEKADKYMFQFKNPMWGPPVNKPPLPTSILSVEKHYINGYDAALRSKVVSELVEALRQTLGHFALFNNHPNELTWPKYIFKCEQALAAFKQALSEVGK